MMDESGAPAPRVIETAWIELSDGCRLAATIWLPNHAGPAPAILEYLPYRRRDGTVLRDGTMHGWFARNGYAAVRVDMRGTGDSDGLLHDEYLPQEQQDGAEAIAWIARQEWCDGNVGMIGISWGGFNALQIAALRPPALKAIVTVCSTDDRYADDTHYMGGALLTGNITWAATMLAIGSRPPDPDVVGARWRALWRERLEHIPILAKTWTDHQHRDAYWRQGSVCEDFSAIECPVLAVGGWADAYTNAIPRLLAGLTVPREGLIGPWAHRYPHEGVPGPAIGFLQECQRWWDRWLKRVPGTPSRPFLRVWLNDAPLRGGLVDPFPGRWVSEAAWPSPDIAPRLWHLSPGRLSERPQGDAVVQVASPQSVGLASGNWCPYGFVGDMPEDQAPDDARSVCFETAPLAEPVAVLGFPIVSVRVSADRPHANLIVRLVDVGADGAAIRVSYGVINLTHRDGHENPKLMAPGEQYLVRLALNAAGHVFARGRRIRLALSTAYWPIVWPSPEPVTLALHMHDCSLELPVRTTGAAPEQPGFAPPEAAPGIAYAIVRPPGRARRITREAGGVVIVGDKDRGAMRLDHIGMTVDAAGTETYRIRDDDPLSARVETDWRIAQSRGSWRIATHTRTGFRASADTFFLDAEIEAREGAQTIFAHKQSFSIARDGV